MYNMSSGSASEAKGDCSAVCLRVWQADFVKYVLNQSEAMSHHYLSTGKSNTKRLQSHMLLMASFDAVAK